MSDLSDLVGSGNTKPWVSGTTYAVGKVVMSPADNYQLYVRVVAGAGTTDPSADATNWKPFGARAIKSIQRGITSLTSVTGSVTVSPVNTQKSLLTLNTAKGSTEIQIHLSSSTTIAWVSSLGGPTFSWELVEYY